MFMPFVVQPGTPIAPNTDGTVTCETTTANETLAVFAVATGAAFAYRLVLLGVCGLVSVLNTLGHQVYLYGALLIERTQPTRIAKEVSEDKRRECTTPFLSFVLFLLLYQKYIDHWLTQHHCSYKTCITIHKNIHFVFCWCSSMYNTTSSKWKLLCQRNCR